MESIPLAIEIEGQQSEPPLVQEAKEGQQVPLLPLAGPPTYFGKHRMAAAITHLQNKINIIQEELEQLETVGESSVICEEVVLCVESIPDPLLPITKGPSDVAWDRWFQGAHHKRWI